jgi:hypothetical protein
MVCWKTHEQRLSFYSSKIQHFAARMVYMPQFNIHLIDAPEATEAGGGGGAVKLEHGEVKKDK